MLFKTKKKRHENPCKIIFVSLFNASPVPFLKRLSFVRFFLEEKSFRCHRSARIGDKLRTKYGL